jgi:hypothetical protein
MSQGNFLNSYLKQSKKSFLLSKTENRKFKQVPTGELVPVEGRRGI